jgi:hypothetical protein
LIRAWDGKIPKYASINELIDQLSESMLDPVKLEKALKSLMQSNRTLLGIGLCAMDILILRDGMYIEQLERIARALDAPLLKGQTANKRSDVSEIP